MVPLAHNSMFVLSPRANATLLHSIKKGKQVGNDGMRISLTFRSIATFMTSDGLIYGQGAVAKTRDLAQPVVYREDEYAKLFKAFGRENSSARFDWNE